MCLYGIHYSAKKENSPANIKWEKSSRLKQCKNENINIERAFYWRYKYCTTRKFVLSATIAFYACVVRSSPFRLRRTYGCNVYAQDFSQNSFGLPSKMMALSLSLSRSRGVHMQFEWTEFLSRIVSKSSCCCYILLVCCRYCCFFSWSY